MEMGYIESTDCTVQFITGSWKLRNFSESYASNRSNIKSGYFQSQKQDGFKFFLSISDRKLPGSKDSFICFGLRPVVEKMEYALVRFGLDVETSSSKLVFSRCRNWYPSPTPPDCKTTFGKEDLIEKSELLKHIEGDNVLIVRVRLSYSPRPASMNLKDFLALVYVNKHVNHLADDLKSMLKSGKESDVTIHVERKQLRAHKCVLSARSPFFSEIFESAAFENKQFSNIEIEDFTFETVSTMLDFMYCGRCDLDKPFALDLLMVSDKYQMDDFKKLCSEWLLGHLDIDNCVEVLVQADLSNAKSLREEVMDFCSEYLFMIDCEKIDYLRKRRPDTHYELWRRFLTN